MSKKNRQIKQPQVQASAPELRPGEAAQPSGAQALAGPAENAGSQPVPQDRKYFFIFWGIIMLAAAAAWILAIVMPSVSESIIERWIMAALAVSLAGFLFFYK